MKGLDQKHDTLNPIETLTIGFHRWTVEMHSGASNKSMVVQSTRIQGNTLNRKSTKLPNLLTFITHDQKSIITFNHYLYAKIQNMVETSYYITI